MIDILVWGTGVIAGLLSDKLLSDVNIVAYVETDKHKDSFNGKRVLLPDELNTVHWDYIVIANTYVDEILKANAFDEYRILGYPYTKDHPTLLKEQLYRLATKEMPYFSVSTDGLSFLFDSSDRIIPFEMIKSHETFSKNEMDLLLDLLLKECTEEGKVFFDIGANVGTTAIYLHRLLPKWKFIAFEPMQENYKLLVSNTVINNMSDIVCENNALSDKNKNVRFEYCQDNSGHSHLCDDLSSPDNMIQIVNAVTLDSYCNIKKIDSQKIGCFWIDVEGMEYNVLCGGENVIRASRAPMLMEFNALIYRENGTYSEILSFIARYYNVFTIYDPDSNRCASLANINEIDEFMRNHSYNTYNLLLKY